MAPRLMGAGSLALRVSENPQADAAEHIAELVRRGEVEHLGLATGASPVGLYEGLLRRAREYSLPTDRLRVSGLDEYVGLDGSHPHSFARELGERFADRLEIDERRRCFLDGAAADPHREADGYEARRAAMLGGVDLQILGLGRNGHIAFNEPGSDHASRTRVVQLAAETIAVNSALREFAVPTHALTQGIGTILDARRIVFVVSGSVKSLALGALLTGPVSSANPASAVRAHSDVVLFADAAAVRGLDTPPPSD